MPKCAFLTIANTDGWFIDDDLVHEPLNKLGWEVKNIPWNQDVDWNNYDLVIIRSTWDYQNHLAQFLKVLEDIDNSSATLLNSLEIVKWNINKNYLFDLESNGIELVPTIKCNSLSKMDIKSAFGKFKTEELIIKPMIGANADDAFRIRLDDWSDLKQLESTFHDRQCMLQPFMQNIIKEGEFSLIYLHGRYSHTVLKTAKSGDFRVQEEHGGDVIAVENPEKGLVAAADKAISVLPKKPFYARVDFVRTSRSSFAVMELELVEPCLHFNLSSQAATVFAKEIDMLWQNK